MPRPTRFTLFPYTTLFRSLRDVGVGGQAGDEDVRLLLRIHEMAHVAWMDDVEDPVTHDDGLGARPRPHGRNQLLQRLDLAPRHLSSPRQRRTGSETSSSLRSRSTRESTRAPSATDPDHAASWPRRPRTTRPASSPASGRSC